MLTLEDKLILLIEECGEVIQAATKCLRFGWDTDYPDYGVHNKVLAHEVGDMLAILDTLDLDQRYVEIARSEKIVKAERAKRLSNRKGP